MTTPTSTKKKVTFSDEIRGSGAHISSMPYLIKNHLNDCTLCMATFNLLISESEKTKKVFDAMIEVIKSHNYKYQQQIRIRGGYYNRDKYQGNYNDLLSDRKTTLSELKNKFNKQDYSICAQIAEHAFPDFVITRNFGKAVACIKRSKERVLHNF